MKVLIEKPDLDTCLTGLILGISSHDDIFIVEGKAEERDLLDSSVICIECGGSGLTSLNNFDHHEPHQYYPPACLQAYEHTGCNDIKLKRLLDYVCLVDDRPEKHPLIAFPSLSNIFSGMLLVEKDPKKQFLKGMEMLKKVLNENIDPFSTMPDVYEWREFVEAKHKNLEETEHALKNTKYFFLNRGLKIGFLESTSIVGIGSLYRAGCDVVILYNPAYGEPPRRKYTISGKNKKVVHLISFFDNMEKGWGGRDTIIGSPKKGSTLTPEEVIEIVLKNL
ncbi:MAG: hypothetical protein N2596_04365 [Syntrophorhabdaceae bacterium]|nr:hypothetical protein [Syntrophorhabdaceae bacterium]